MIQTPAEFVAELQYVDSHGCVAGTCGHDNPFSCSAALQEELEAVASQARDVVRVSNRKRKPTKGFVLCLVCCDKHQGMGNPVYHLPPACHAPPPE